MCCVHLAYYDSTKCFLATATRPNGAQHAVPLKFLSNVEELGSDTNYGRAVICKLRKQPKLDSTIVVAARDQCNRTMGA
jgi:hypothetical protein